MGIMLSSPGHSLLFNKLGLKDKWLGDPNFFVMSCLVHVALAYMSKNLFSI